MIRLREKSSLPLHQAGITRFEPVKCDFPAFTNNYSASEPRPMMIIHNNENQDKILIQQKHQQRSKRRRSMHIRKDLPCPHHQSNARLRTHDEQHEKSNLEQGSQQLLSASSSLEQCSKEEHHKKISTNLLDYGGTSSLSSFRQSNASKRYWLFTPKKQQATIITQTNQREEQEESLVNERDHDKNDNEEDHSRQRNDEILTPQHSLLPSTLDSIVHDQSPPPLTHHIDRSPTTRLFRRKAAVPTQLLKWAFDASMSLYDHLGDDYDDDDDHEDNNHYHQQEEHGGMESSETLWNKHAFFDQNDHYSNVNHDDDKETNDQCDGMHSSRLAANGIICTLS